MQVRPTTAEISLPALRQNLISIRERTGPRHIWAAVKGDAYGHGAIRVARTLEAAGCSGFAVALVEEGIRLREAGIRAPILCLGGIHSAGREPGNSRQAAAEVLANGLTPVVFDEGEAEALAQEAQARGVQAAIHLKVDTGMGRLGVPVHEWGRFLDRIARFPLRIGGMMTHFATSEDPDPTFLLEQARRFDQCLLTARRRGVAPEQIHLCNSGAILSRPELHRDAVRPGLLLYGISPDPERLPVPGLTPVLTVRTRALFVKNLPPQASVSYGRRFQTARPSRIMTLPVGYADGYPRALSGRASVLVQGQRCPVVGTVCMDLMMVDVTDLPRPAMAGEEVVLLGRQGDEEVSAEELARLAGTISYEILCGFSERVPRTAAGGQEPE